MLIYNKMSITIIVLGIILVILIYILYLYLSPSSTSLTSSTSLLTNTPAITKLTNPTSPRYAYGLWIYVNSWGSKSGNNTKKTIFYRNNNINLYLDANKLNLNVDVYMNNGKWLQQTNGSPVLVTDNFPLQKWCCIILSMDNSFLDCYLDGKLIVSQKLNFVTSGANPINVSPMPPPDVPPATGGAAVVLGGIDGGSGTTPVWNNFDAVVNNFTQWDNPLNPQMAWNSYMAGNGNSFGKLSSFNAKLNILKDNSAFTSISLF
jgi:hypothetical protein